MDMKIFNVKLDGDKKNQIRKRLVGFLSGNKRAKISKINTEFLLRALNDDKFKEVLNNSDLNIVDGRGVMWAARFLTLPVCEIKILRLLQSIWQLIYSLLAIVFCPKFIKHPIAETIPGVEAFNMMMRIASDASAGVFLFGSCQKTLDLAVANIKKDFPNLIISGTLNGYDYQNDKSVDVVKTINKTDAKLLIVALGSPKQEYWIDENIDKLKNIKIAVGEGGTLDRIAYPSQKAPKFINQIGLEWLWRMIFNKSKTDGRNRLGRTWNAVPVFMIKVLKWKMKYGQTKI